MQKQLLVKENQRKGIQRPRILTFLGSHFQESDSVASGFYFGVCFSQSWWNASSSTCRSSGMEDVKYLVFWSGWLLHRSQNMVLAWGLEPQVLRALKGQRRPGSGAQVGQVAHRDDASAATVCANMTWSRRDKKGEEQEGVFKIHVDMRRNPSLPPSPVVQRSSLLPVLCHSFLTHCSDKVQQEWPWTLFTNISCPLEAGSCCSA